MDQVGHNAFNTNLFAPKSNHQIPQQETVAKYLSFSSYQPMQSPCAAAVVYKECLRNHSASSGGHALDGCGEFMPLSSDQTDPNLMKCAACGCHRNFHRHDTADLRHKPPHAPPVIRNSVGFSPQNFSLLPRRFASSPSPSPSPPRHINLPPPPPPHTAVATRQQHSTLPNTLMTLSNGKQATFTPPEHLNQNRTKTEHRRHNQNPNPNFNKNSSPKRKRFRSKFSNDQKQKMKQFAEGLNWKMQRNDEKLVTKFCEEVGVSKGVLKVWMHNNKNTIGKMIRNSSSNHSSSCNNEEEEEYQQFNDHIGKHDGQLGMLINNNHHQVGNNGSSCSA